jgi:hypothetical protein
LPLKRNCYRYTKLESVKYYKGLIDYEIPAHG